VIQRTAEAAAAAAGAGRERELAAQEAAAADATRLLAARLRGRTLALLSHPRLYISSVHARIRNEMHRVVWK
jgi:hypothetical protein